MSIHNALASLPVNDFAAAVAWYEKLLGRSAHAQPMPGLAEWQFDGGGWLQVYQLPERAGKGSVTLAVDDLDAQASRIREIGVSLTQPTDNEKVKTFMIQDPDGNSIAFAEAKDPALAH